MKTLLPALLIALLTLLSCSSEEEIQLDDNGTFLKSYTLSRDNNGEYSIDYELEENTSMNVVKDAATDINEIYLFSGDAVVAKSQNKTLSLTDDQLALDIYEEGEAIKSFIVEDGELEVGGDFLENYSITDLGNNTYKVDFKVKEGIAVSYKFNEESNVYEIHLEAGVSKGAVFTKTYIKTGDVLKIDFVNSDDANSAKGNTAQRRTSSPGPRWVTS